jgi:MerR family transcriptional regulator/heat shock protein HspR
MGPDQETDGRPLYAISVAADLTGVNPQALRDYEAKGLIEPSRSDGGTRRYSDRDIERVKRIRVLLRAGLNLVGIAHVLEMEAELRRLRAEVTRLRGRQSHGAPKRGPRPE